MLIKFVVLNLVSTEMKVAKTLPSHPFWNFSVKIYRYRVVEDSLIRLQNERGLNVNVILFCVWYGLIDQGRLSKAQLKLVLSSIQPWHERIVLPLRRLRQQIEIKGVEPWITIRKQVLENEIASEHVEQLLLVENFAFKERTIRNNFQKMIDICKSISSYCQLLQIFLDHNDAQTICSILCTVFSKIDQGVILRYCMDHLIEKELKSLNLMAQLPLDL